MTKKGGRKPPIHQLGPIDGLSIEEIVKWAQVVVTRIEGFEGFKILYDPQYNEDAYTIDREARTLTLYGPRLHDVEKEMLLLWFEDIVRRQKLE